MTESGQLLEHQTLDNLIELVFISCGFVTIQYYAGKDWKATSEVR